ncbi:MAG: SH3 domain-containing protein [Clostridia bacterium]|nr:SH3 domain-containing protein [Clostridia bacterium]
MRQKLICSFLIIMFLLSMLCTAVFADCVYVTGDVLNIRSGPDTSYQVLGKAQYGDYLDVLDRTGNWIKVSYWGVTGFVNADYVSVSKPSGEAPAYTAPQETQYVYATGDTVNLRSGPDTSYGVVGRVMYGDSLPVVGRSGEWLQVMYWGVTGYIRGDYVSCNKPEPRTSTVSEAQQCVYATGDKINIRTGPDTSYDIAGTANYGDYLIVVGRSGEWLQVSYWGVTGYVRGDIVSCNQPPAKPSGGASASGGNMGVVDYAKTFIGVPYVYGGSTPSGFDCSGFVKYVFAHFGVSLPRTSYSQMNVGTPVSREELQPGDLVVFRGGGHVGIYCGNNQYIHAPQTGRTVSVDEMNRTLYCARRIL